jgi:membrane associated rhomboid family serine protease
MTVILVILGAMVLISLKGFQDNLFFNRYLFNPVAILEWKQWDRMLMSGFLHANWPHLLFNGFALYSFSGLVLAYLGNAGFLIIFFGSILLGNFTALVARKHEMHYRAVGASGGVSGVVLSAILLQPSLSVYLFLIPFPIPGWLFAVIFIGVSAFGMKKQFGNIGHEAHMGGAFGGIVLTMMLAPGALQGFIAYMKNLL